jgi:hypothetical protein
MRFGIENNVIASYKRLSYDAWYAFAEFVDNSTQSYFDNREILDKEYAKTGDKLRISIDYNRERDTIVIIDNSIGMDNEGLEKAFKVGQPPENPHGRSKYGLGMKTAACWFGDNWTIKTKKLGANKAFLVKIDVAEIAKTVGEVILNPEIFDENIERHYTVITITDLNRKFVGKTLWKIRDFLGSIYRFDISEGIEIKWNGTPLSWIGYEDELYVTKEGVRFKKIFEFEINNKPVKGWVGVLGKGFGSRKKAGFSIIQNRRVIQTGYKPTSIYGEQEDGGNDLINQRVVGELMLDKFSVSHTKDKIVWEGEEEDLLDEKMGEYCKDARELALTLRFNKEPSTNLSKFKEEAISVLESEFKSDEITNYLTAVQPYPEKVIEASFKKASKAVSEGNAPALEVHIGSSSDAILVLVFFNEKSEFDPYELMEATIEANKVAVIINMLHPHVQEMSSSEAFTNFVRHCVYDGVSEWKATKLRGSLQPFTIKFLKDGLLRIPFEIKSHQAV